MKSWIRGAAFAAAISLVPLAGTAANAAPAPFIPRNEGVYSGYAATASAFHTITGRWKQPAVTCGPPWAGIAGGVANAVDPRSSLLRVPGLSGLGLASVLFTPHVGSWIGLEGSLPGNDKMLVQTGTQIECVLGVPQTVGLFDVPSTRDQVPAVQWTTPATMPDDEIEATVTWDGHDTYRMTLSDLTRGWSKEQTDRFAAVPQAALAVVESIPDNVPAFSPVSFTDVKADGKPLDAYRLTEFHIDSPTIAPTPLHGPAFTVAAP